MLEMTVAETLLYSTVKLTACKAGVPLSTGTGFFMGFQVDEVNSWPVLITNKHVVAGADSVSVICHIGKNGKPSGQFKSWSLPVGQAPCANHPDPEVDLYAIPFGNILNQSETEGAPIFYRWLDPTLIPADEDWDYFDAIEGVTMVGCPRGISDEANNLPIVRRGITATSMSKRYNGKPEFMVDMACFPGSSGSLVLIFDTMGYFDKRVGQYVLGKGRLQLVGVLYGGPVVANNGKIILGQAPKVSVTAMMHLGNVVRSSEIWALKTEIVRMIAEVEAQRLKEIGE